jgi:hypothetical protein
MKKAILLLAIFTAIGVTGCKSKETKPEIGTNVGYKNVKEYPKWVIQPRYDKGLAGVGSTKITELGFDFARKEAMASARLDLAGQIGTKVENMFKSYATKIGVGDSTSVDALSENVTKEIVNQDLQGATLKETWISDEKELFVLMIIDNENIIRTTEKAIENPENYTDKNLEVKMKADSSQAELQKELNLYFGSSNDEQFPGTDAKEKTSLDEEK